MRSLMGKLNKFALAPGSLSDIGAVADGSSGSSPAAHQPKQAAVQKKVEVESTEASEAQEQQQGGSSDNTATGDDSANVELSADSTS
mmetsp:Transcript_17451/g.29368  ORF Transcript_17451/g.29368 Transcript_17451/m.29368 type:complete len:87 (+) Transcript_17451:383-643(+)